ncbi:hypothetical protein LQW54_008881 [Pestalotiopsis sp. IQ-011]
MNILIQLYFEVFEPVFPVVHREQVDLNSFWPLALAICAIGCRFTETQEFSRCVAPFQEFLRRVLAFEAESTPLEETLVSLTQALILSQIGLLYSGQRKSFIQARGRHSCLMELVDTIGPLKAPERARPGSDEAIGEHTQRDWESWITAETKRRLGYSAWNPSLVVGVTTLFLEKKVKKDIGQFSSLLLLHGIYEEIKRVQCYLDRPLSSWVPSLWLNPGSSPADGDHPESSPPSDPKSSIAVWRNAALDCVDVLHWAANATVASAAGVEHSTVLHLHLSRVVLLVPYTSIQALAKSISTLAAGRSNSRSGRGREDALRAEQEVVRWAQQDEHVCFASITSGSGDKSAERPRSAGQAPGFEGRTDTMQADFEDEPEPTFIRLDRPNDDEMVQQFVKSGRPSVMRAHITGVGNISSPQGPAKILREGRKILSSVSSAWSRTREYISILESVEAVTVNNQIC